MTTDPLTAALNYASQGWPVHPLHAPTATGCTCKNTECTSPAKHPRTAHGLHDATTDPDTIRAWWTQWPTANIGLRTGVAFDVLDIDDPSGGQRLAELADGLGLETATCWLRGPMSTTAKGSHLLYLPTGYGNKTGIVPKVDWRGTNGYIVAPPSKHASGHIYTWHPNCPPDEPLGAFPAPLLALLDTPERTPSPVPLTTPHRGRPGATGWSASGLIARLAEAGEGTRNDVLHWAACKVGTDVRDRKATETEGIDALDRLAVVAERIGLGSIETEKTIGSGYHTGVNGRGAA